MEKENLKKYRLKKPYPGSPKKGIIVEEEDEDFYIYKKYGANITGNIVNIGFTRFRKNDIENHPEFWEKIKEKEYEVLSVSNFRGIRKVKDFDIETGGYLERRPNSNDFYPNKDSFKHILSEFTIYSVKRLSDGKIFFIGDKIKAEKGVRDRKYTFIDEIYYNEHDQLSYKNYSGEAPKVFTFDEDMEHYKEPIFITEDGYSIFKDNSVQLYGVDNGWINYHALAAGINFDDKSVKWFISYDERQKYIDKNKPVYSKQEMYLALSNLDFYREYSKIYGGIDDWIKSYKCNII